MRILILRVCWVVLVLAACGGPSAPGAPTSTPRREAAPALPELASGSCGGFAERAASGPTDLLGGRLRMAPFTGLEASPRAHNIMAAPPNLNVETRLFASHATDERQRFVVYAVELFAARGADLEREVRGYLRTGYSVYRLAGSPLSAVVGIPDELDASGDAVPVLQLFTATDDRRVQQTTFFVTPSVAETGGCRRLALDLARTVQAGPRRLVAHAGPRTLRPGLGVTLPDGAHLSAEGAHDFSVYRVSLGKPLSQMPATLGIYVGGHPSGVQADGANEVPGELFGSAVTWLEREQEGVLRREVIVAHPDGYGYLHLFLMARDVHTIEELVAVAGTLTTAPARRSFATCPEPAPEPNTPPPPDDPDHALLMNASVFTDREGTWARPRVPEVFAFRALASRPHAASAFAHLATSAHTTEGRLYGLAGLSVVDAHAFDRVFCAARLGLADTARGLDVCGESEVSVPGLVESAAPDAVRGEPHWGELEWRAALHETTADIRGGGVGRRYLAAGSDTASLLHRASLLRGDHFLPPLDGSESDAPALRPGRRGAAAEPYFGGFAGGGCAVRADGRVACWGGERPGDREAAPEVVLLPDVLRYPLALDGAHGAGCMLDAAGTRVCWGGIEQAAHARAEACGTEVPSAPLILRQFDDGPWARLVHGGTRCAIDREGELYCFPSSALPSPDWADLDSEHHAYRVPIEGEVAGVTARYNGTVVWTADGRVLMFDQHTAPHEVGRFEGLREVAVGIGAALFAQLDDGRVMALGVGDRQHWYEHGGRPSETWREISELRGGRLFLHSYHGCALFEDGRVTCFGNAQSLTTGADSFTSMAPTDFVTLRGARTLVVAQRRVCAWLPGDRLRCIGEEASGSAPESATAGVTELDVRGLIRRARPLP